MYLAHIVPWVAYPALKAHSWGGASVCPHRRCSRLYVVGCPPQSTLEGCTGSEGRTQRCMERAGGCSIIPRCSQGPWTFFLWPQAMQCVQFSVSKLQFVSFPKGKIKQPHWALRNGGWCQQEEVKCLMLQKKPMKTHRLYTTLTYVYVHTTHALAHRHRRIH